MKPRAAKRRKIFNTNMDKAVDLHDQLAMFEEFKAEILPALRRDLTSGMSAEELYKKYETLAAARMITIGLTEVDSSKAIRAIEDIRNRTSGKPKETKEVEHKFSKLKDEELDAYLLTQLEDMDQDEEK